MKGPNCSIEDRTFEPGSMVCNQKLCFMCEAGSWEKKGALDLMGDAMLEI